MKEFSKEEISAYVDASVPHYDDLYKQVVYAYIDAMLNSTEIQSALSELERQFRPTNHNLLLVNYYGADLTPFLTSDYLPIITYSMMIKDQFLYELISERGFTGEVRDFIGLDLSDAFVEATDENPDDPALLHTDVNTYTDGSSGVPVKAILAYYCDGQAVCDVLDIQNVEQYEKAREVMSHLLIALAPARLLSLIIPVYNSYISRDLVGGFVQCVNPFSNPDFLSFIDALPTEELSSIYALVIQGVVRPDIQTETYDYVLYPRWNPDDNAYDMLMRCRGGWAQLKLVFNRSYDDGTGHIRGTNIPIEDADILFTPSVYNPLPVNGIGFNRVYVKLR